MRLCSLGFGTCVRFVRRTFFGSFLGFFFLFLFFFFLKLLGFFSLDVLRGNTVVDKVVER